MKSFKKWAALGLSLAMVFSSAVVASASSVTYSVKVQDNKVSFITGGKAASTYTAKNADITLQKDDSGELLVCFYDAKNEYTGITLKDQTVVTIDGVMDSLTLNPSIGDVDVVLPSTSWVGTMAVKNTGRVQIGGDVTKLTVSGAAPVRAVKGSTVSSANVTSKKATFTVDSGATVSKIEAADKASIKGASSVVVKSKTSTTSSKKSSTYKDYDEDWDDYEDDYSSRNNRGGKRIELSYGTLYVRSGLRLKDIRSALNMEVDAYVYDDDDDEDFGDTVRGECTWDDSSNTEVTTGEYRFTFTPRDNDRYRSASARIQVVVE